MRVERLVQPRLDLVGIIAGGQLDHLRTLGPSQLFSEGCCFGRVAVVCMESSGSRRDTAWAMSEENVKSFYKAHDAFNRRDFDAYAALADPDIEVYSLIAQLLEGSGGPYRGHDGLRRYWEKVLSLASDMSTEVAEVRDLGAVTVARARVRGHGIDSDAPD